MAMQLYCRQWFEFDVKRIVERYMKSKFSLFMIKNSSIILSFLLIKANYIMQAKKQIVIKMWNKEHHLLRFSENGVYQFRDNAHGTQKKIFTMAKKLTFRILKTQILNSKYKFIVKVCEDTTIIEGIVDGKQQLEKLLKITGYYCTIIGLQEMVTSFKKIGEGAFAQVYEAVTNYQQRFALKSFQKKAMEKCDKTKKAFANQIQILKKLNSPFIVPFDYIFETEKAYYLKMQYLQKTLKERITCKLLVKQQKNIMKQLLLALSEMKAKNIIHRDLKPQNIMMKKNEKGEEECMIIDFGLGTPADVSSYLYFRCGTPGFLSPEIANLANKKEKQACSSDMFSLGCIFYKMLTGHYLFSGKTAKQVLLNNRKCLYPSTSFDKLSNNQRNLISKMLDPQPNTRVKPQQALSHPYFTQDVDDSDQIPDQQCVLDKNVKKIISTPVFKNMDSIKSLADSYFEHSVSSMAYKDKKRQSIKDSCATFEFGLNGDNQQQNMSHKSSMRASKTPDKMKRQSRFSRMGKDVTNMI